VTLFLPNGIADENAANSLFHLYHIYPYGRIAMMTTHSNKHPPLITYVYQPLIYHKLSSHKRYLCLRHCPLEHWSLRCRVLLSYQPHGIQRWESSLVELRLSPVRMKGGGIMAKGQTHKPGLSGPHQEGRGIRIRALNSVEIFLFGIGLCMATATAMVKITNDGNKCT
jgi:hypothetical protein